MNKAVLISIQSKWCEKIANGKKTIEVRKNRPQLKTPFKCYIYCTNGAPYLNRHNGVCYLEDRDFLGGKAPGLYQRLSGTVIGEFTCDEIYAVLVHPSIFARHPVFYRRAIEAACLTDREVEEYSDGKDLCGWHISDLVIYDRPKKFNDFVRHDESYDIGFDGALEYIEKLAPITRPPQSWCYVKEVRGDG